MGTTVKVMVCLGIVRMQGVWMGRQWKGIKEKGRISEGLRAKEYGGAVRSMGGAVTDFPGQGR